MANERLGFIGLGVMGAPMAGHLAKAGRMLTVFDLNGDAARRLAAPYNNVAVAESPRAVAASSDVVLTMLPSGREVRAVALGDDGLLQGLKPGGLLLDTSSSEPWFTREVASRLAEAGIAMVDAPVSGAEAGAKAADLVFMIGGASEDVARVKPILSLLGKRHFHLGPVGSGHVMKSINNLVTAVTLMATTEGMIAGAKLGLDPAAMNDVLDVSTGGSWVGNTQFRRHIFTGRYDDQFKAALMMKDINIAARIFDDAAFEGPVSAAARRVWSAIQQDLPADSSLSEIVRAVETESGVALRPKS
ncbi:MAG TPA: NAD(P)-dependent oxidoreductase [Stellaceae bacterium]|nr:NAD(P)-dependent oxidoreductase [Stellaceae bacterium]